MKVLALSVTLLFATLSACNQPSVPTPVVTDTIDEEAVVVDPIDEGIVYASDSNARFVIMSKKSLPNRNIEVVTKRTGPSGVSFARREISCATYSYRYLGEGDSLEEALKNGSNVGEMSALTGTSASSDVANEACKQK